MNRACSINEFIEVLEFDITYDHDPVIAKARSYNEGGFRGIDNESVKKVF